MQKSLPCDPMRRRRLVATVDVSELRNHNQELSRRMKVLMLGWEYPPYIAGGLGTACEGLTRALARQGVSIHFVVPKVFGSERAEHMTFSAAEQQPTHRQGDAKQSQLGKTHTTAIPAFLQPYWSAAKYQESIRATRGQRGAVSEPDTSAQRVTRALIDGEVYGVELESAAGATLREQKTVDKTPPPEPYANDIFSEVARFTSKVLDQFATRDFDIIHAHDWMTFPAAVALAKATGKPLVVHVHSLEHDRSGFFYDRMIDSIEKLGITSATKVIAVSHYTKSSIERRHHVPDGSIAVVHNGVYPRQVIHDYRQKKTWPKHVVLFLGRVTFQKGPDYFLEVATRVVPHVRDIVFVLAGSGDMLPSIIEEVQRRSLEQYFLFPGFVQGVELEELFSVADLYVMPSVSEPFGIAALEAISFETPVVLSKQSGASEVLRHVLKSDFWDTERMADLILNALLHPELRAELVAHAKEEVAALHWDAAAEKTLEIYQSVISQCEASTKEAS